MITMEDVQIVHRQITAAEHPEDIFGMGTTGEADDHRTKIKFAFRFLAKTIHPDKHRDPIIRAEAEKAFKLLNELEVEAQERIEQGIYGKRKAAVKKNTGPTMFKSRKYSYTLLGLSHTGGTGGIFRALVAGKDGVTSPALVKIPHSASDNDLMENEAKSLKKLRDKMDNPLFSRTPVFLESIKLTTAGNTEQRVVNTFIATELLADGWFSLEQIRSAYPDGVDSAVMAFIFNRVLEALTYAHACGILHRMLLPQHIIIHAESHKGVLVDWSASCTVDELVKMPYYDRRHEAFYAPEFFDGMSMGRRPNITSDIYMAAWCMAYVLGGDPTNKIVPERVELPIRQFLNKCLQPHRRSRFHSAVDAYQEFAEVCTAVFGPKKFVKFVVPAAPI